MSEMHEIQDFSPVDAERWQHIKNDIKAKLGMDIPGDSGEISAHGITVKYDYDPTTKSVTIQTLKVPFYIGETVVDQKIHNEIEGTK
jgi:hypothetical protein